MLDASTIKPDQHAMKIQEAIIQDGDVVLTGAFDFSGKNVVIAAPHQVNIRGDVSSGVKPTINGGGWKQIISGKEVFHPTFEINSKFSVTIEDLQLINSLRVAILLNAAPGLLIKHCTIQAPISDQPPGQNFHTAVGFIMAGNVNITGEISLDSNVFEIGDGTTDGRTDRTLGILINKAGSPTSTVRISGNIISNVTGRGIEFRDYSRSGIIESNRITMSPKGVLEPDFLANGIRCGSLGKWQISSNTIECSSPDSGGILLLCNSVSQSLAATVIDGNSITMSIPEEVLPGTRAAGIELFQNCSGTVVTNNRFSGRAQNAFSILKGVITDQNGNELSFSPTGNTFSDNDHWDLSSLDSDISVGVGATNTMIGIRPLGFKTSTAARDHDPNTEIKTRATVKDHGTDTKMTGPHILI
jgi:hypothetical protein